MDCVLVRPFEPPQPPPPKPRPKLPPPRPLRAPPLRMLKSNRLALTLFRLPRTESCIPSLNLPYDPVTWYLSSVPPPTLKFPKSYGKFKDRKSTRLNSSHVKISYAVFCLKK